MKYFLGQDSSCHWYLVENGYRREWYQWVEIDDDDPQSWTVPTFARAINHPSEIVFEYE